MKNDDLHVAIVQGPFLPVPATRGGAVEKLWFELGFALAKRGVRVTHVSREYPGQAKNEIDRDVHRLRVSGFSSTPNALLNKTKDLLYSVAVLSVLPRADVYVTNTFFLPLLPFWSRGGVRYVSVHRYPQGQYRFFPLVERLQCVSHAVAEAVKLEAPGLAPRVKVIPNYVSVTESPCEEQVRSKFAARELLYVGRLHEEKGLHHLLDCLSSKHFEGLADWCLRVVGPHEPELGGSGTEYAEELRTKAKRSKIPVIWEGAVFDRGKLSELYAAATFFVYPSVAVQGEAFGLAPLEAMGHSTPAIVSSLECFLDFMADGENGWVIDDVCREQVFSPKLESILGCSFEEYRRLCYRAREKAAEFSIDSVVDALITDFKGLVHECRKSAT